MKWKRFGLCFTGVSLVIIGLGLLFDEDFSRSLAAIVAFLAAGNCFWNWRIE